MTKASLCCSGDFAVADSSRVAKCFDQSGCANVANEVNVFGEVRFPCFSMHTFRFETLLALCELLL